MRIFDQFQPILRFSVSMASLACSAAMLLSADTLVMRNGATVQGTYLGGDARQIRIDQNGTIRSYDVGQVQSVIFSETGYQPPPPPPAQPAGITIPIDTAVTIRMIDSVNSDQSRLGETFRASLAEPVYVNGQEVIPRGADVMTRLVTDQHPARSRGAPC